MKRKYRFLWIIAFFLITVILWNVEGGYYILYPFTILGTWFHEMAHGLTAILMGASFSRLQLFDNGSGVAEYSYTSLYLGNIGTALIAAAGPIGPTLAGTVFFRASVTTKYSKIVLLALSILLAFSFVVWLRPIVSVGALIVLCFAAVIAYAALKKKADTWAIVLQFLGVQAFASVYMSIGYLFSSGGNIGSSSFSSDTQVIADNLLLPYWVWAALLLVFSAYMFYASLRYVIKKS